MAMTNYMRNKLVDWFFRGVAFTPPTEVYVALSSGTPTAAAAGTELTGTDYARQGVPCDTTNWAATNADGSTVDPSSGTSGTTSNNALINWGNAGSAWGTVSNWEIYDAVTGGNRLAYGSIVDSTNSPTSRTISSGDPVTFPISALKLIWN